MCKNPLAVSFGLLALLGLGQNIAAQTPAQFGTNFYEFVNGNITWQNAGVAASNRTFLGVAGHLATITSAAENGFLVAQFAGYGVPTGVWFAGQVDAGGVGRWMAGPESGLIFSTGQTPATGAYANWGGIEPNNAPSFTWMNLGPGFAGINTGQWADDDNGVPSGADPVIGYFVEYESPPWRAIGAGCAGSAGIPALVAVTPPNLGTTFSLAVSHMPASGGLFLMALGFSDTVLPGFGPLPFELGPLGAPQCFAFCDFVSTEVRLHAAGNGTFDMAIPNVASLAGLVFFQQAYVLDAPANALGITAANAGRALVQ